MPESLYATLASRVEVGRFGPPGTVETRVVETVDNDIMGSLPMLELPIANPRPPGTTITLTIETVDNDVMGALPLLPTAATPMPDPPPGTRMTATVETMDEDVSHGFVLPSE